MPYPEYLLAAALPAIYLFDSLQLLTIGESVITTRAGALRGLSCGGGFELAGRRPFLPNPLTPMWPELRVEWIPTRRTWSDAKAMQEEVRKLLRMTQSIGSIGCASGLLIVILAPLALALREDKWFVACAAVSFVLNLIAGAIVAIRRRDLGITRWQAWSSVLIALICMPCAPNLARGVLLHRRWSLPAHELEHLAFESGRVEGVHRNLLAGLAAALRVLPDDGTEHRLVSDQMRQLAEGTE